MSTIQGHDIVCLSTSDWEYPIGSKQQIMQRLAGPNRVLYVEYQASWLHPLRHSWMRDRSRNSGHLRPMDENLWVYTPRAFLPGGPYLRPINALNQSRIEGEVREAMKSLGFRRPILWLYTPMSQPLVGRLDESLVVYHCIAEFPAERASSLRQSTIGGLEKDLVRQADIVFAIASDLVKKFSPWAKNLHYLPNGVDWQRFADLEEISPRAEMEDVPRPRIGITGIINYAIDVDLLEATAKSRPDWHFVHVGTLEVSRAEAARLDRLPNWTSFGRRPYEEIPGFISAMDVCLLPLTDTPFTRSVSSLRLMEYLAMGRPVVATELPDIKAVGDVVICTRGVEGFTEAVERALKDGDPAKKEQRRDVARANCWDAKVEALSTLLEKAMEGRP